MKRICVFLSSKSPLPEPYVKATKDVAKWIGESGHTLVYGGARKGLMETLACTVRENGGRVIGVVPQVIVDHKLESDACSTVFYTADLQDRKATFMRESDVFLALPGGIGTLDEIFTVLAAKTLEKYPRPVVLFNVDGCWDSLIALLDDLCDKGLISEKREEVVSVVESVEELSKLIKS